MGLTTDGKESTEWVKVAIPLCTVKYLCALWFNIGFGARPRA
jgi:hypothetical protein